MLLSVCQSQHRLRWLGINVTRERLRLLVLLRPDVTLELLYWAHHLDLLVGLVPVCHRVHRPLLSMRLPWAAIYAFGGKVLSLD